MDTFPYYKNIHVCMPCKWDNGLDADIGASKIITSNTRFPMIDSWPCWISVHRVLTRSREPSHSFNPPITTIEK